MTSDIVTILHGILRGQFMHNAHASWILQHLKLSATTEGHLEHIHPTSPAQRPT